MRILSLGLAAMTAAMLMGGDAQAFGRKSRGNSGCGGGVSHSAASFSSGHFAAAPVSSGCGSCGQSAFLQSGYQSGIAMQSDQSAWIAGQPQIIGQSGYAFQPQIIGQSGSYSFQSQPQIIQPLPGQQQMQSGHLLIQNNANIQPGMTFIAEPGPQQGTIILRPSNQPMSPRANDPKNPDNK